MMVREAFHFSPRPNLAGDIAWRTWSQEAFAEAETSDKPILLSISAVWCHWCHVMDETSYSDSDVISYINQHFIPIRVDNDRRPDINARYNMGGWPTTALLAPDGSTLTGATYLPPRDMLRTLQNVQAFYRENTTQIRERLKQPATRPASDRVSGEALRPGMIARILEEISDSYDGEYGGFGVEPKFPQTDALELLLLEYRVTKEQRLYDMVAKTMLAMSRGGTYDHVEGGFFRYSTTRDWSIPHFEKMTEDHGGLLRVLCGLYKVSNTVDFRAALVSAIRYIRTTLRDPQTGLFAGSQDADESYFALPLEERKRRQPPYVDRTSYSNWTASLAAALFAAGDVLADQVITKEATETLDTLHAQLLDANGLLYHYLEPGRAPQVSGLLTDQAAYLRALLDAHEYTGHTRFLARAQTLAEAVEKNLAAPEGGYYDHANLAEALGNLKLQDRPLNDNGQMADSLLRLADMLHENRYRERAEETLLVFIRTYGKAGSFAATYVRALRRYLSTPSTVMLIGEIDELIDLRDASLNLSDPLKVVRTFHPEDLQALQHSGLSAEKTPVAYVCAGTRCAPPAYCAPEIRSAYEGLATPAPAIKLNNAAAAT
ncbi:MAG: DUF255 domain-containing protein [Candidatus Eremiobacteraeota bacterium]|nr:DUF255 domain-containing protein [Candidatus Eremiobacteraeota bacterium]